jgi:hypothetical protein
MNRKLRIIEEHHVLEAQLKSDQAPTQEQLDDEEAAE